MGSDVPRAELDELLSTLLLESRYVTQAGFVELVARRTRELIGASDVTILLVELEQRMLIPVPVGGVAGAPVDIDGTLPGRVYRSGEPVLSEVEDGTRIWTPLFDGTDRLGTLGLTFDAVDDALLKTAELLTALIAELLVAKSKYGDAFQSAKRRAEPSLAAELQWATLPPLTCNVHGTTVSGILEPAYDIGGDSFDYALDDEQFHLAVFDAMGHGLSAALTASLAVAGYRHARRNGVPLERMYRSIDAAISAEFQGERFVTAHLAVLDAQEGRLRWVNAGHPGPLLLRDGRVIAELMCEPTLPLGLTDEEVRTAEVQLEPGDRVFFFTDGVVESRSRTAEFFGHDRLVDFLEREAASDQSAPEILRRLSHAILAHQGGELQDDATILFLEWRPPG